MEESAQQVKEFTFVSKSYRLRKSARSKSSFSISVPAPILRHQAETCGLRIDQFVLQYEMIARYVDDRPGFVIYEFRKI